MNKIAKMRVGLVLPVALVMASMCWGVTTEPVSYIDADGTEKSQTCTLLSSVSVDNIGKLTTGCYVVDKDLSYTTQMATNDGNLTLILADGKTLSVNNNGDDALVAGSESRWSTTMQDLTIYGQKEQTGSMVLFGTGGTLWSTIGQTGRGIHAKNLVINGGVISVTSGSSDAIYVSSNVTINGGSVTATAQSSNYNAIKGNTITLAWRNLTDYVKASSFSGTVKTASGKATQPSPQHHQ